MMKMINKIREITGQVSQKHVGAYAAQSAYFFVLSMIPIILLLLAIIQYTPVTKADVMTAVVNLFPETNMQDFMVGIVNEVYNQSKTVIPITAIVALWSAGKGVLAVSTGLNCAYELRETRNYVFLRIRASIYTILFIAAIVMALVLSVFGNNHAANAIGEMAINNITAACLSTNIRSATPIDTSVHISIGMLTVRNANKAVPARTRAFSITVTNPSIIPISDGSALSDAPSNTPFNAYPRILDRSTAN